MKIRLYKDILWYADRSQALIHKNEYVRTRKHCALQKMYFHSSDLNQQREIIV